MAEMSFPMSGPAQTKQFEGFRPNIYKDTKGKRTIGYGFNIDEPSIAKMIPAPVLFGLRPMTREEADGIFGQVYHNAAVDALNYTGEKNFYNLTPQQKASIVDMAYNLGANKLAGFTKMKKALDTGDMEGVAREMINSNWYSQVGNRSKFHVSNFRRKGK